MLTDNEIRALRDNSARTRKTGIDLQGDDITELCTRVLEAETRVKALEDALQEIADAAEDHWLYNFARKALEAEK